MNILQLNNKVVNPPADGGARLVLNTTLGLLASGHTVRFLAINASRNYVPPEAVPAAYRDAVRFASVRVDTSLRPLSALRAALRGQSYFVSRFYDAGFLRLLRTALAEDRYDIIELEHSFLGDYVPVLRQLSKARIVLRPQNAEFRIWERLLEGRMPFWKRAYLRRITQQLKTFETQLLHTVDGVLPLTETDQRIFESLGCPRPQQVIPMGWDFSQSDPWYQPPAPGPAIPYHLGAMNWQPNAEALQWFLEQIWPRIHARFPEMRFHCAGNDMPAWAYAHAQAGVEVQDRITRPFEYVAGKNLMLVPLISGSGMRAKILEAMALGKCVISTRLGADGIRGRDGEHFLLADTPEDFAAAVAWCHTHPEARMRIAQNGRELMLREYSIEACGRQATAFYERLLRT